MATVTGIKKDHVWGPTEEVTLIGLNAMSTRYGRLVTIVDSEELRTALNENSSDTGVLTVPVTGEDGEKYILYLKTKFSR